MPYRYSLIRFVPDPARGEFVNIAAIAGDDDAGDWELRQVQNPKRAKAFDDADRLRIAFEFIDTVERHILGVEQLPGVEQAEPMSTRLLERWTEEMQNVVQISPPAPVVAETAEAALDLVFRQLVVDPAARQFPFQKKHRALAATGRAYRTHRVPEDAIAKAPTVVTGAYERAFDFAVVNGRILQLVQCWSFQLPNQAELAEEVKAWAWVVRALRDQGGHLELKERSIGAGRDLEMAVVYIPPAAGQPSHAMEEAVAAATGMRVPLHRVEEADQVGQRAFELLRIARGE